MKEVLKEGVGCRDVAMPETERMQQFNAAIGEVCDSVGATVTFMRTGSRTGVLPALRKQLARKAVNEYGISLAETARQFGVTANAVSHMLKRQYRNATQT